MKAHPSQAILIASLFILAGCAPAALQRDQIAAISRNTKPTELDAILGKATPLQQLEFRFDRGLYYARTYNLHTATRPDFTVLCTPSCMVMHIDTPVFTDYIVIQELPSKKLLAWGTFDELSKDPDTSISTLLSMLKEHLAALRRR